MNMIGVEEEVGLEPTEALTPLSAFKADAIAATEPHQRWRKTTVSIRHIFLRGPVFKAGCGATHTIFRRRKTGKVIANLWNLSAPQVSVTTLYRCGKYECQRTPLV